MKAKYKSEFHKGSIGGHANKVELQPAQLRKTGLSKQMGWE
jgi:hypothetical protein